MGKSNRAAMRAAAHAREFTGEKHIQEGDVRRLVEQRDRLRARAGSTASPIARNILLQAAETIRRSLATHGIIVRDCSIGSTWERRETGANLARATTTHRSAAPPLGPAEAVVEGVV